MADERALTAVQLQPDSILMRRIRLPDQVRRNGVVAPQAFKASRGTLSLTLRSDELQSQASLHEYRRYWKERLRLERGPAICVVHHRDLVSALNPPLPPRHAIDDEDERFGHLHYVTDEPNEEQRKRLATIATGYGLLANFDD